MPPRIDEMVTEAIRERFQIYANNEPIDDLQGIWTMPENLPPPPEVRHIDERLFEGYFAHNDILRMEPMTTGVDLSTNPDGTFSSFVSAFNEALRKNKKEDEEYKKTLDKQWNELVFGQAQ